MSLWMKLVRRFTARSASQIAGEIARHAYSQVRHASERTAAQLQPAVARGYIRAKATPILRAYVDLARANEPALARVSTAHMLQLAGDLVVQSVWPDVATAPRLREPERRAA